MSAVRSVVAATGAFLAALVASSHHALHMMLLSLGIGGSAMFFPHGMRRLMLVVSLAMTALSAWWFLRRPEHRRPAAVFAVTLGAVASVALVVLSVVRHGW